MRFKNLFFVILLLLAAFVLSSCGGGGGNGGDNTKTVNYMPNFDFDSFGSTASSMMTASLILPTGEKEAMANYYLFAPMMVGFTKGAKTLSDGQVLSYNFGTTQLKLKVSIRDNIVTLAGAFDDNSGSMEIILNTATDNFSYQQYIDVQDSTSKNFIVYLKLVDVKIDQGYYHTKGNFYCVQSGTQNSFMGEMDYYAGIVPDGMGNDHSVVGNIVIGCYGKQHSKIPDSHTPPTVDSSLSDFTDYINKVSWNSAATDDPIILYYDKTIGSFVCSTSKGGAKTLGSSYTTPPWPLL